MGAYFDHWMRRLGILTLFVACMFAAGWIRSYDSVHSIDLFKSQLQSANGSIHIWWEKPKEGVSYGGPSVVTPVPYWSIVLPMALVSASLLLGQLPRHRRDRPSTITR